VQILKQIGIEIGKDIVRRVLAKHFHPDSNGGPWWLTIIGHAKDRLWSIDLFRFESILHKTHHDPVVVPAVQQDQPECKTVGLPYSGIRVG
jgi:putative transposase